MALKQEEFIFTESFVKLTDEDLEFWWSGCEDSAGLL